MLAPVPPFLRFDERKAAWKGKLIRFRDSLRHAVDALAHAELYDEDWELCIHHHVLSANAAKAIADRLQQSAHAFPQNWARAMYSSAGTTLPENFPIDAPSRPQRDFIRLTHDYYNPAFRTPHTDVGGTTHLGLGYAGCALPLVLEHNTPNNAVALLWADVASHHPSDPAAPPMRPLFRRRQRHV